MAIEQSALSYTDTNCFSKLILDYINGKEPIRSFYKHSPNIKAYRAAIDNRSIVPLNRQLLSQVLNEQNSQIANGTKQQQQNINAIAHKDTFTVCTGHQLCLFTGPLYFIYKIITTINLAKVLKKEYPKNNFVPVYWMASEDHDFEEVNHLHLFGKRLEWNTTQTIDNKKTPVGKLQTASLTALIEELSIILGTSNNAITLMEVLKKAYLQHNTMAAAMRYLLNYLFGADGLVIIDADNKALKAEFKEIIKDDIFNNKNFDIVKATQNLLEQQGIKPQIHIRAINCFYMQADMRERIEFVNNDTSTNKEGIYKVMNTDITFSKQALIEEIDTYPERFSPNVVLRPLYQEKILPNIAYIGGPSEISYWMELKAMFEKQNIPFPVLMLRNSVLWIDAATNKKIKKLLIPIQELFLETNELVKKLLLVNTKNNWQLDEETKKLTSLYNAIALKAATIDSSLVASVESELQKNLQGLKNIQSKLLKAEKQKNEIIVNQLNKIKETLFPKGSLQERYDNFIPFYLKHSLNFISLLKEHLDPFENKFIVLLEED